MWSELERVGGARALPALLADGKAPPRVLRRAALLLEALIDAMPPEYAVEMASLLDGPWLNAAMRALSASRHWAVYVGAQPAADGGYEAAAAAAAFSEGQAVEWLRGELPEVHRARAALLRLLRKVAAAEEAAAAAAAEYYGDEAAVAGGLVSRLSGGAPLKELVRVLCADFGPTGVRLDADGAAADAADGGGPARAAAAAREAVERREAARAGVALRRSSRGRRWRRRRRRRRARGARRRTRASGCSARCSAPRPPCATPSSRASSRRAPHRGRSQSPAASGRRLRWRCASRAAG